MTPPLEIFDGNDKRTGERRGAPPPNTVTLIPHPHTAYEECPGGCKDLDIVNDTIGKTKDEIMALEKRLKESHDQLLRFETRLDEGSARMGRIEALITENSTAMGRNTTDTAEILSIMRESQTAFRLIERVGNTIKWVAAIVAPIVVLWFAFKEGLHK